jgi:hypothetical protein
VIDTRRYGCLHITYNHNPQTSKAGYDGSISK